MVAVSARGPVGIVGTVSRSRFGPLGGRRSGAVSNGETFLSAGMEEVIAALFSILTATTGEGERFCGRLSGDRVRGTGRITVGRFSGEENREDCDCDWVDLLKGVGDLARRGEIGDREREPGKERGFSSGACEESRLAPTRVAYRSRSYIPRRGGGDGLLLLRGDGDLRLTSDGDLLRKGEGDLLLMGDGERLLIGERDLRLIGEGDLRLKGEGDLLLNGDGDLLLIGDIGLGGNRTGGLNGLVICPSSGVPSLHTSLALLIGET